MTDDATPADTGAPLIAESSKVFAVIAAATLLVAGAAGIVNGSTSEEPAPTAALGHAAPHDVAAHDDGGHDAGMPGHVAASDGHLQGGGGDAAGVALERRSGGHAHGDATSRAAGSAAAGQTAGHGDGGSEHSDGHEDHDAAGHDAAGHDAAGHEGSGGDDGAGGHQGDDHAGHGGADAAAHHDDHGGCADDHPATRRLVAGVQFALDELYPDVATLVARGYIPYFDAMIPGGYPPGGEGISHWLQPHYIDDGVVLDPLRPETVLLDDWWRPIGMMFIGDPDEPVQPVYVDDDGTACSPWHPHTDYPARFGWWFYRMVYDDAAAEGDYELADQTPAMMHVWAVPNPAGVYAAHDYPPQDSRKGPPGPLPSYFGEGRIATLVEELFGYVP